MLQPLLGLQASELRDSRFDTDVQTLLDALPSPGVNERSGSSALAGRWTAEVRYAWQSHAIREQFELEIDGSELFGTGTFLGAPRAIEEAEVLADGAKFTLHSEASLGEERRRIAHRYRVRVEGDLLHVRMQSTGGFSDGPPLKFVARRMG